MYGYNNNNNPQGANYNYNQMPQNPAFGYNNNQYQDDRSDSFSNNPMIQQKRQEIREIDHSLKRDYLWYLIWLWFDFFLNIGWFFFFLKDFVITYQTKDLKMIISAFLTVFIVITLAYGLSAYNGKRPDRQNKFITLIKWLIAFYILDIPVLIFSDAIGMLFGRIAGIVISFLILYRATDLEKALIKRRELIGVADSLMEA